MTDATHCPANLLRLAGTIFYDSLLATAVAFMITGLYLGVTQLCFGQIPTQPWVLQTTLFPCLLIGIFLFYGLFWRQKGQTLGLQTWRLQVITVSPDPLKPLSWKQCFLRFAVAWISFAAFGIGYFWALFNKDRLTWQDLASKTRIIDLRPAPPSS